MLEPAPLQPLDRLLRPTSIAVIGGGQWCANIVRECRKIGFQGALWPVHPTRAEVGGITTVARIEDLPAAPDAAFIGINREATIEAVEALAKRGAGGAVCFASGFREADAELGDGSRLQDALLAAAGTMRILGPNCYGFLNALDGAALWPDQHGAIRVERGVAIITQSSNIAINLTMQRRGLPLAYMVTAGNQAQTDLAEIGAELLADERVTALGLHIEGIADLLAFEALGVAARALGKPVVVLKVGASDQARAQTVSHTASLAGGEAGARALFTRLGFARVSSLTALLETLKLLHVAGPLQSDRIASMSCSGGEAGLIADRALHAGVAFPALTRTQRSALRAVLGPKVALANPLDYHTYIWGDREAMTGCFSALMEPGEDSELALGCVVLDFPRADRCDASAWMDVVDCVAATKEATGVPMALVASLPENMPEEVAIAVAERGIVPLCGLDDALEAIALAVWFGKPREVSEPVWQPVPIRPGRVLSEAEAKAALSGHGIAVPRSERCASVVEAVAAAQRIGFPVVVKGEGVAHKTEVGAVRLNLPDSEAVRLAAGDMAATAFLVEEMVTGAVAELLVGVTVDPVHGCVLTIGAGGVFTELMKDSVSLLLPVCEQDVLEALQRLKIAPILAGYRGAPGADLSAIVATVMRLQAYVGQARDALCEAEINPLLCCTDRAVAADALIRLAEDETERDL